METEEGGSVGIFRQINESNFNLRKMGVKINE